MATKLKKSKFKDWATSHSLHHTETKLPFRLSVRMTEEIVDFMHGTVIGLLIGLVVGLIILRIV
jgi:tetrahydromethanopterin S-methyltransferase subunit G